jgi:long-subunit acyl-CoA synthetase (AMP-forming)
MTAVAQQIRTKVTTVASRVRDRGREMPDQIALREKDFGIWQEVSWADYWNHAELVGHALLALGIEPGDRVAVHSENRREWLYSDVGAIAVRATTVGLYPTNPPAEVAYLLSHSGARVLIAAKARSGMGKLPTHEGARASSRLWFLQQRVGRWLGLSDIFTCYGSNTSSGLPPCAAASAK